MDRFPSLAAALMVVTLSGLVTGNLHAQALYKWTDASGKVHYGDRAAAPEDSVQMAVPVAPAPAPAPGRLPPPVPRSSPADRISMSVECTTLIGKLESRPTGANWQQLTRQFKEVCPGIAYTCQEDRAAPQNNRCGWIDKSAGKAPDNKAAARNRKTTAM